MRVDANTVGSGVAVGLERAAHVVSSSLRLAVHVIEHVDRLVHDVALDSASVAREVEALVPVVREANRHVRTALRATPRFARIVGEVLRIVAAYRIHARKAPWLTHEALATERERLDRDSAERLFRLANDLGGGLVKLGQLASSRLDLLPPAYVEALSRLQDRARPVPFEDIAEAVERELGAHPDALFASFAREPLATASLAQVHAAELADGRRVVVKVQIPGVDERVEIDLAALEVLGPILADLLPQLDLETIFGEVRRTVRAELDFGAEAAHARAFAERFQDDPRVVVPLPVPERSARRVLTLERLDGRRVVPFLEECEQRGEAGAADRDRWLATVVDCFAAQVLAHGMLHADPHPGNFLVLDGPDGPRLGLVDFGAVVTYAPAVRRAYAELAGALLAGRTDVLVERFEVLGFRTRDSDAAAVERFASLLLDAFRDGVAGDLSAIDPAAELEKAYTLLRENPLVAIPQDFVMLGRVFAALGGLVLRFKPRIALFAILMPHLATALASDDPAPDPSGAA